MKVPSTGYSTWQCVTSGLHDLIRAQPTESTPAEIFKRAYCRNQLKSFAIAHVGYAFGAATLASLIKRASPLVSLSLGVSLVATMWIWKKWGHPSDPLAIKLHDLILSDKQEEANRTIDAGADIFRKVHAAWIGLPYYGRAIPLVDTCRPLLAYAVTHGRVSVVNHLLEIVEFSEAETAYALKGAGSKHSEFSALFINYALARVQNSSID